MSAQDWPGEERRRPPLTSPTWAVRAPLAAWLQEHAAAGERGYRVLDVGCGPKPYYPFFAERASEYVGVDVVENPAAELRGPSKTFRSRMRASISSSARRCSSTATTLSQAIRELRRVTAPGGRVLASTHGTQVYHPSPQDYWRWTHAGLARLFEQQADWESVKVAPGAGTATTLAMLLGTYVEIALRRTTLAKPPVWLLNRLGAALDARSTIAARARAGLADCELPCRRDRRVVRLFRRNALGIYAVYAAAMVSGLVVTPILLDSIGTDAFGIWAFIGGITIYLAVLDIGARAVRRALHGRGAWAARPGGDQPGRFGGARALRGDRRAHARRRRRSLVVRARADRRARRISSGTRGSRRSWSRSRSRSAFRSASSTTCSAAATASTCRTSATSSRPCSTRSSSRC